MPIERTARDIRFADVKVALETWVRERPFAPAAFWHSCGVRKPLLIVRHDDKDDREHKDDFCDFEEVDQLVRISPLHAVDIGATAPIVWHE